MQNPRTILALLLSITATTLLIFLHQSQVYAVVGEPEGQPIYPLTSSRVIVELTTPPLAVAYKTMASVASADGTLDADSTDALAYIAQVQAEQAVFVSAMQSALPNAAVSTFVNETGAAEQATYQVVLNAVAIDVGEMDRDEARTRLLHLPDVKAVYLDQAYQTQLYTSTTLINAPLVWNSAAIGGVENAGEGIRFASVDGGVHKDAPMFSGEGYTYPQGYAPNGLGLTSNNNGKIIVSRVYFRPWDPPAPGDENPWPGVQGTSHGVHTTSIAVGNCVDDVVYAALEVGRMCGVAPRAYVMSYRVFYYSVNGNESFYTVEGLAALEDVVRDGAQVVNNSWGEGPISEGGEFDPIDTALINANAAGVFVSMSTGNEGPGLGTSDHPSADYINVAASTTSGTLATGRLSISAPPPVADENKNFPFSDAVFGEPLPIGVTIEYSFTTAAAVDPANGLGCDPFPANAFDGVAAVISRGNCFFSQKVFNAQEAGADFVVIYNNAGDEIFPMGCGEGDCSEVTIPSLFVGQTNGEKLVDWYDLHASASKFEFNSVAFQAGSEPDEVVAFSSRGPAVGNTLKPDIAAPGSNILAQGYTPGATGEARHLGYGQNSGTSMASPHVAGAAVLLRQVHPEWRNAQIKSALMSSAKYIDIYTDAGAPAQPLDMGAGRLDVAAAADPGVILDPPSLSFGLVTTGTIKTLVVKVTSVATATESYALSTLYTGDGFTQTTALPGFTISPTTLALNPGETKSISITFNTEAGRGFGDNQGYVVLAGDQHDAHMPAWARVVHAQPLADVLIIDHDFNDVLDLPGYLAYYTDALEELGYTYSIVDTSAGIGQETAIPDATTLAAYRAVILFTGDNFSADGDFTISTPLTQLDQDRLVEYLNSGGTLLAMGQDLSATLGADEVDAAVGNRNFLYVYRLGANWIQDSVTGGETPSALVLPSAAAPAVLEDLQVDLTQPRRYTAQGELSGAEETPPITDTETSGIFAISLDVDQNRLEFEVTVIPTPTVPITVTNAHIHHGVPGVPGPVVKGIDLDGVLPQLVTDTLTLSGVITDLTPVEIDQLLAGEFYFNVHTEDHPDGEVRGQIEPGAEANQPFVDEIDNQFHDGSQEPDPDGGTSESNLGSTEILEYAGPQNQYDGTVAILLRDHPSLERPGIDYHGRSAYAAFGLEGMNDNFNTTLGITPTTRSELLGLLLDWAWSEAGTAVISPTMAVTTTSTAVFSASLAPFTVAAITPPEAVSYRWDFGDGSDFVTSASGEAKLNAR